MGKGITSFVGKVRHLIKPERNITRGSAEVFGNVDETTKKNQTREGGRNRNPELESIDS